MTYAEAKVVLILLGWTHSLGVHWFKGSAGVTLYKEGRPSKFLINIYPNSWILDDAKHFKTYEEGITYLSK